MHSSRSQRALSTHGKMTRRRMQLEQRTRRSSPTGRSRSPGLESCNQCGMIYSAARSSDVQKHLRFHSNRLDACVDYNKNLWRERQPIVKAFFNGDRIVRIGNDYRPSAAELAAVRLMRRDLAGVGAGDLEDDNDVTCWREAGLPDRLALMFVRPGCGIVGCCLVEPIRRAYRIALPGGNDKNAGTRNAISNGSNSGLRKDLGAGNCIGDAGTGSCIGDAGTGSCFGDAGTGSCIGDAGTGSCIGDAGTGSCIGDAGTGSCIGDAGTGSCIGDAGTGSCIGDAGTGSCIGDAGTGSFDGNVNVGNCNGELDQIVKSRSPPLAYYQSEILVPASCGIYQIWCRSDQRRTGVATALLDAARQALCPGLLPDRKRVAFCSPSPSGYLLARDYVGGDEWVLVY